jgi:P22 coat protein - gene protein 5
MALNKEIWLNTIQENFYPNNSFAAKSIDDSGFVSNHKVHIPNAGAPSGVQVNRTVKPAGVNQRTDQDLTYTIDELTTNPIYIPNIDMVELSYDKRQSILFNDRTQLQTVAAQNLLYKWTADVEATVSTTGDSRTAHTSTTATGNRKKITKGDILKVSTLFNSQDIPMEGRYVLLDAAMYNDLLEDLTDKELSAFLASANAQQGTVGRLFGFDIMLRSQVLRTTAAGKVLKWEEEAVAGELAAGLAWQQSCVSRAMGEVKMFDDTDNPLYYGDIYSFLMRTGGSLRRYDKKGVVLLIEAAAA